MFYEDQLPGQIGILQTSRSTFRKPAKERGKEGEAEGMDKFYHCHSICPRTGLSQSFPASMSSSVCGDSSRKLKLARRKAEEEAVVAADYRSGGQKKYGRQQATGRLRQIGRIALFRFLVFAGADWSPQRCPVTLYRVGRSVSSRSPWRYASGEALAAIALST